MKITKQEAKLSESQKANINISHLLYMIIEQVAIEARESEYVDAKSGVSARLTISALENLASAIELRMLLSGEKKANARIADLSGILPAINGKIELVYEGEQEGAAVVAQNLISKALRNMFVQHFPDPALLKKKKDTSPYQHVTSWFTSGNALELLYDDSEKVYRKKLDSIPGLAAVVETYVKNLTKDELYSWMEFVLHALAEHSQLGKQQLEGSNKFSDLFGSLFNEKNWDMEE